ncbi:MAG TPA: low temperature requirement protein A [Solirubrobacteraceae bacterium]|nr:low temperature requirement protein A [Solirubrobacteraceae bacterium]
MSTELAPARARRLTARQREGETVSPLELFFDLVFVLAFTQCTALMADEPTWEGLAKGLLVLGVLWWAWVGYAWLTSVVDPEEDAVRLVIFAAMAALLVVGLAVPGAFEQSALIFACAYAFVRLMHIALFMLASREDPNLRSSVIGLGISTAIASGLLVAASFTDGALQGGLWALALVLDIGGPYLFGAEGWKLVPHHFSERHGLIMIIALGESIVAIGVGAEAKVDAGIVGAAVIGTAIAAALWWLYFDVVAIVAARRLDAAEVGRDQNEMARDSYSILHLPMVAGIILLSLGMKKTLGHTEDALKLVPATALLGGSAMYLLAHVAFRFRHIHTLNMRRLAWSVALVAFIPVAVEIPALATISVLAAALVALIAVETHAYGESRARTRAALRGEGGH